MMKYLIFVITLIVFVGCKDNEKQNTLDRIQTNNPPVVVDNTKENRETLEVYKNSWINEIKTNKEGKWLANKETNEGVKNMLNSLETIKTNTLEDYKTLAKQLDINKNYIIKNCTMKGEPHDNLHVWLLPLMDKIEALSEAKTIEDASKLKKSTAENIYKYNTYFQ